VSQAPGNPGNGVLPLVSICIPAYNAAPFIAETLKSALGQDYPSLEIVVSDDCSTDDTVQVVRGFAGQGVRLIRQPQNLGRAGNLNAVIRASAGKYVCKLDADDLLGPDYLSSLVPVMEAHPNITFAHCACRLIDGGGNFKGYARSISGSFLRPGLREWPRYVFGSKAVNIILIRRAAFETVGGYDRRFGYSQDWKMMRELLRLGDVYYHDRVLASYRVPAWGKPGVRVLQAREHLLQLEDMDLNWPPEVPGKDRLLPAARRQLARDAARAAAFVTPEEAKAILSYLPRYGNYFEVRVLARLVRLGGAGLIRAYVHGKAWLRQGVKQFLYQKSPAAPGLSSGFFKEGL
jgi:hypothetical protein